MSQDGARRIGRGRGHSYTLDGEPVMGVTTILRLGFPKPALVGWAAREVAEFVAARREILTQLNDAELVDLCRNAPGRIRDAAANRGTEVHRLAEQLAHGVEVEVPQELVGHVDSYLGFLEAFEPTEALVERACFNRSSRYGGTFDLVAKLNGPGEGHRYMVDIKTSGSGIYGEVALQLAGYGHVEIYLDADGAEQPMPELERYAALWVREDGFDLYPITVGQREWTVFQNVHRLAWWIEHCMNVVRQDPILQRQAVTP